MPDDRAARFHALHAADEIFVMPNPWDVGSALLLQARGFPALATTSAGFAWTLGKLDTHVTRPELVAHVAAIATAIDVPLNVDSERLYPDEPGGVAETVRQLADAGAAGCSIEDWNPATGAVDDMDVATERVAVAVETAHALDNPMVITARAENHLHGIDDLDDTIARLRAYRAVGADCVYAPWLQDLDQIARVVDEVGAPVNVLAVPGGPSVPELASVGVCRISTGSLLASAAYAAMLRGADELSGPGTSQYATTRVPGDVLAAAFAP